MAALFIMRHDHLKVYDEILIWFTVYFCVCIYCYTQGHATGVSLTTDIQAFLFRVGYRSLWYIRISMYAVSKGTSERERE